MRIVMFTETYLPYINGVVTHISILKEGLEKLGHDVFIVTSNTDVKHHVLKDNILYCPAKSMKKIYGYGLSFPVSQKRFNIIKRWNPDICHVHQEFGVGLFGAIAAKMLKIPLVYTVHTMYDEYIYYVAPKLLEKPIKGISHMYFRFFTHRASEITGPSKKSDDFVKIMGSRKAVTVVPNCVELAAYNRELISEADALLIRDKYNIPHDKCVALFVGRLGREKSVDVILENWSKTINKEDNLHLMVLGNGPELEALQKQAIDLGLSGMVTFTKEVLHAETVPYYAACDIYLTASLSDTMSISMLEGMAMGLPVIQRYDPINLDQVISGTNGYLFHNAKEMASALREFRDLDAESKSSFRKKSSESVGSLGSIDLGKNLYKVYESAVIKYKNRKRKT